MKQEENIQIAVCNYLRYQYPKVMFTCDLASGMKLTIGQAVRAKLMRSCNGWPDLFISQPMGKYSGLYLELKKDGTKLTNSKWNHATPHIAEQADILDRLASKGYAVSFAVGFDQAKQIIDAYLK
jgi:hypothetical protein